MTKVWHLDQTSNYVWPALQCYMNLAKQWFRWLVSTITNKIHKLIIYLINAFWWHFVFVGRNQENRYVDSVNLKFGTILAQCLNRSCVHAVLSRALLRRATFELGLIYNVWLASLYVLCIDFRKKLGLLAEWS